MSTDSSHQQLGEKVENKEQTEKSRRKDEISKEMCKIASGDKTRTCSTLWTGSSELESTQDKQTDHLSQATAIVFPAECSSTNSESKLK